MDMSPINKLTIELDDFFRRQSYVKETKSYIINISPSIIKCRASISLNCLEFPIYLFIQCSDYGYNSTSIIQDNTMDSESSTCVNSFVHDVLDNEDELKKILITYFPFPYKPHDEYFINLEINRDGKSLDEILDDVNPLE